MTTRRLPLYLYNYLHIKKYFYTLTQMILTKPTGRKKSRYLPHVTGKESEDLKSHKTLKVTTSGAIQLIPSLGLKYYIS